MEKKISWELVLKNLCIILALSVNYTCGLILNLILRVEIAYLLFFAFSSSFLAGILVRSIGRSIFCVCFSIVLSLGITMVLISAPLLVEYGVIIVGPTLQSLLPRMIFVLFVAFLGILAGSLVGEYFSF
ncbi:hypothetical protein DRO69_02310 [Candidatus Bathyarchaeota archaeon]|nr:MAG: hypothetical protein DRO69_02310 [Candidatus Bathyarchaeota archaeon]